MKKNNGEWREEWCSEREREGNEADFVKKKGKATFG